MKKIISFSLWGHNPIYTIGAIENAKLKRVFYPDWICRFYCDKSVPRNIIDELISLGSEIVFYDPVEDFIRLFWRFSPNSDNTVERFIVRDSDARLTLRESEAVKEWELSKLPYHILRDHPNHHRTIMGGMWGAISGKILELNIWQDFLSRLDQYIGKGSWEMHEGRKFFNVDQVFLDQIIWPIIRNKHIAHDEFYRPLGNELKFKIPMQDKYHFVGNKFQADGTPIYSLDSR